MENNSLIPTDIFEIGNTAGVANTHPSPEPKGLQDCVTVGNALQGAEPEAHRSAGSPAEPGCRPRELGQSGLSRKDTAMGLPQPA